MLRSSQCFVILIVGFGLGFAASRMALPNAFAMMNDDHAVWTVGMPDILCAYGQNCPHCHEKLPDRYFIVGSMMCTRGSDGAKYYSLTGAEIFGKHVPTELVKSADLTFQLGVSQPTVGLRKPDVFEKWVQGSSEKKDKE
jgi:hypothetical protein